MDLTKIKSGYERYDLELDLIMGTKVYDKVLLVDENKEPYRVCLDNLNSVYYYTNSKGEQSSFKRFSKNTNSIVVCDSKGQKIKLDVSKQVDNLYSLDCKGFTTLVPVSLLAFAITDGEKICTSEWIYKIMSSGLAVCNYFNYPEIGTAYEGYKLTDMGRDFLSVSFKKLNANKIDRFINNSNLEPFEK